MPNHSTALAFPPPPETPDEAEYQALIGALSESARGRAFLAEHARRTRAADTKILLGALEHIEVLIRAQKTPKPAAGAVGAQLPALLAELRAGRAAIDTSPLVAKVARLGALLDLLESRLADLIEPDEEAPKPEAVVPEPPANDAGASVTLLRQIAARSEAEPVNVPASVPVTTQAVPVTRVERAAPAMAPAEAFATIMALSEDERIALFS